MTHQTQSIRAPSMHMETREGSPIDLPDTSPAAFGEIYRRYLGQVYGYLYMRTGNAADAEDLTSQVFLAALEALPQYQHQGYFSAWLFSIARRKAADYFRRRPQLDLDEAQASPEIDILAQVIHKEEIKNLAEVITRLPEEDRELLRLRFAARLSFAEIAALLGRSTPAVKMSLYRMLERLEIQLEDRHD